MPGYVVKTMGEALNGKHLGPAVFPTHRYFHRKIVQFRLLFLFFLQDNCSWNFGVGMNYKVRNVTLELNTARLGCFQFQWCFIGFHQNSAFVNLIQIFFCGRWFISFFSFISGHYFPVTDLCIWSQIARHFAVCFNKSLSKWLLIIPLTFYDDDWDITAMMVNSYRTCRHY